MKTVSQLILESLSKSESNFVKFLSDKKFKNSKSKIFLYHGTSIPPEKFNLKDDYDGEDGNGWGTDLPEGYLFLTTSIEEAAAYGNYIMPCELKKYDNKTFKINANNPSQVFDDDYGISIVQHTNIKVGEFGFMQKFEESGKSALIIKGTDKQTVITYTDNVIPRTDLATEFYGKKAVKEAKKKDPNKFGCLMLDLEYDDSKIKALFEDKDLFKDEGGYEEMHHVTILYGFHDEVDPNEVLKMSQNESNFQNVEIALDRVSLFKNEKFDVVKFDVMNSEINKLNKLVAGKFPYTNKYPVYHAHSTIAYVNPGEGEKYLTKLKNIKVVAKPMGFIFSSASGKKIDVPFEVSH